MPKNKIKENFTEKNARRQTSMKFKDDNELVTKGFLRGHISHALDTRFEEYDQKMRRYIGALMEDNQHKHEQLVELINVRTEALQRNLERYIEGNEEDKEKTDTRLNRLESKVLLA